MADEQQEIPFEQAIPAQQMETDRVQIKAGMSFTIGKASISTKTKYGKVGRIEAYQDGKPTKLWTTSKTLIASIEEVLMRYGDMDGNLSPKIRVTVYNIKSENKRNYLSFSAPLNS